MKLYYPGTQVYRYDTGGIVPTGTKTKNTITTTKVLTNAVHVVWGGNCQSESPPDIYCLPSKRALNLDVMQLSFMCKELTNESGCRGRPFPQCVKITGC